MFRTHVKIARDIVAVIKSNKAFVITEKDVVDLKRRYVMKASVYASMPSSKIDMVMAKRNVMEMFGEINSLLKIDYLDFNVDAIASKIISSLEHESTVAIVFAAVKWTNTNNYAAQGALNMSVAQITESACVIYFKSIIRSINDNIEFGKAVNKEFFAQFSVMIAFLVFYSLYS